MRAFSIGAFSSG